MYRWTVIPEEILNQLQPGVMLETELGGKRVVLLQREDKLHAFAATCPHAGVPLCNGWIDARGHVVCPLHHFRFNPANGYNSSGEGYKLTTYPVRMEEGKTQIGFL